MKKRIGLLTVLIGLVSAGAGCSSDDSLNPDLFFNGTFIGTLTQTPTGGAPATREFTMVMTTQSPLDGFFVSPTGVEQAGAIEGMTLGTTADFAAEIEGDCTGAFNGELALINEITLNVDASGNDCNGDFTLTGSLARVGTSLCPCWDTQTIDGVFADFLASTDPSCTDTGIEQLCLVDNDEGGLCKLDVGVTDRTCEVCLDGDDAGTCTDESGLTEAEVLACRRDANFIVGRLEITCDS